MTRSMGADLRAFRSQRYSHHHGILRVSNGMSGVLDAIGYIPNTIQVSKCDRDSMEKRDERTEEGQNM